MLAAELAVIITVLPLQVHHLRMPETIIGNYRQLHWL